MQKNPLFNMELWEYYKVMIPKILTLPIGKWYKIRKDREDYDMFIDMAKMRIDMYNDFEFNFDYTTYRRILPPQEQIPKTNESTYTIEYREQDYELNDKERNLPDPIFKSYSKKDWDRLSGRIDK